MLSNKYWRLMPTAALVTLLLAACGGATPAATEAPATEAATPATTEMATAAPTEAMTAAATQAPTEAATQAAAANWTPDPTLLAAAQKEGQLTVIALPHDWCDYGDVLTAFKSATNLTVNELNPDAGSGDEVQAIIANESNPGPQAPDVVDVGESYGPKMVDQKLVTPYKVTTWDSIPDSAKAADGSWYGDYYGVLSFLVNTDVQPKVPMDWKDLLDPAYKGQVALSGDPRVSNQATMAVYAAALANGGDAKNVQPGLDFFAQLNKSGNLVPTISNNGLVAKGETPVRITWDYNALAAIDSFAGNPKAQVVVPPSAVVAGVYVQAISAFAPHPNAAKLWMEFLYSDQGQLLWLKGYCHPIRYNDLAKNNKIPADLAAKLPSADLYAKAVFPSLDDQTAATTAITGGWDKTVGANIK